MYETIKNVIQEGKFELSDMIRKIDVFWLKGDLAAEQRTELQKLAQGAANPLDSVNVFKKLEELDRRILQLENSNKNNGETEAPETPERYPEFISGKWYYTGDRISFDGKQYECTAPDGIVCVWNPADYPAYWQEITE